MENILYKLWELTLQASVIAGIVMLLRLVLRKAPRKILCSLWALVAIRLLIPFSIPSPLSLMPAAPVPQASMESHFEAEQPIVAPDFSPSNQEENHIIFENQPENIPVISENSENQKPFNISTLIFSIWCFGAASMLLYEGISYGKLKRKVSASIEAAPGVYCCDYISSPFVLGCFRPRIYFPSHLKKEDIPYILAHEKAHIRRLDPFLKSLGLLLLAIHWFNPVLWLAFILFCRDIESACDEKVIKDMGEGAKVPYADALLNCSLPKAIVYPLAFGEIGVKQRIKDVLSYKKPTLWITLAAILALVITAVCFLTSREPAPTIDDIPTQTEAAPEETVISVKDITENPNSLLSLHHLALEPGIRLMGTKGSYEITSPKEITALKEMLNMVSYDPESLADPEVHYVYGKCMIDSGPWEDFDRIVFSPDFTRIQVGNQDGMTATYSLTDSSAAKEFFTLWTEPFYNKTPHGSANCQEDRPWEWSMGLEPEMLRCIRMDTGYRTVTKDELQIRGANGGGLINQVYLPQILNMVHGLKQDAFQQDTALEHTSVSDITTPKNPDSLCMSLTFLDAVNQKALIFRWEGTDTDLYVTDDYEIVLNHGPENVSFSHWKVSSDSLREFFTQFQDYQPTVMTFTGWKYDWQAPVTAAHGDAKIEMRVPENWEIETVPYTDFTQPFGIRIRPSGQSGSLFFSFWPAGHHPTKDDPESSQYYLQESEDSRYGTVTTGYPSFVQAMEPMELRNTMWNFIRYSTEVGDYVIINDGADAWFFDHLEEFSNMQIFCKFNSHPISAEIPKEPSKAKTSEAEATINSLKSCGICGKDALISMLSQKEINAVQDFLRQLSANITPVSEAPVKRGRRTMIFSKGEKPYLCFSEDGTHLFLVNETETLKTCRVSKPEIVNDFFRVWSEIVYHQEVTEGPMWNQKKPWLWTSKISADNIASAYFPKALSEDSKPIVWGQLDEFLTCVNTLPKTAFIPVDSVNLSPKSLMGSVSYKRFNVFLKDPSNVLAAAFIYEDGKIKLIASEQLMEINADPGKEIPFSCWEIDSELLSTCMARLYKELPDITLWAGWKYDWTFETVSHDDLDISIYLIDGWEKEVVPYTNSNTPWGIRIRPEAETEGWIFFSAWPTGFHKEEENRFYCDVSREGFEKAIISYPDSVIREDGYYDISGSIWSYQLYKNALGDFVILNDGADSWFSEYASEIDYMTMTHAFPMEK